MKTAHGIPLVGLGTYPLNGDEATEAVRMAISVGYRHIDTAQMYGNERAVGQGVATSGVARGDIYLVTKVDPGNLGAAKFDASVQRSVDDLGTAPDLLLIHWPPADEELDGVVERLVAAKGKGWTRAIGVSNFTPNMMRRAQDRAGGQIICNQVEFHPLLDQSKVLAAARELGIDLTAYSPIARGAALKLPVIERIAAAHGRPASEIVLRWIVQQGVVAIPKTSRKESAVSNLNALLFHLSDKEMAAISALGTSDGRTIDPSWMAGRWDT
jgi:2,5-diketo-D-gluconate reductase B